MRDRAGPPATGCPWSRGRSPIAAVAAATVIVSVVAAGCTDDGAVSAPVAVSAYVAPWDPRGDGALDDPPPPVDELSPVWYQPTDNGGVTFASDAAEEQADGVAARGTPDGVRLVPSVSNFRDGRWDGDLVSGIIGDPDRRSRHIGALADLARPPEVAGIDIDYEALPAEDRSAYSAFVRELADALGAIDRKLTVTVHAKTEEPGTWAGARAQDWEAIGAAADEVRIMAYDHAWEDSPPGPVAPLPWVDDVLRLAVGTIPRERVSLGVPTYGYDWPDGEPGDDLAWADATAIAEEHDAAVRRDDESATPWFTYTDDGRSHTVWYEDARSMEAKLDLVARYEVGGVVVWKIGGEDPAVWTALDGLDG